MPQPPILNFSVRALCFIPHSFNSTSSYKPNLVHRDRYFSMYRTSDEHFIPNIHLQ